MKKVKRNVLLNPGPATTTDTVKYAQVIPDICPREKEFGVMMNKLGKELLKIVHASEDEYIAVLFCGSGTLNIDVCLSSLIPDNGTALIIDNGAYSERAKDVCDYYHINTVHLKLPYDRPADLGIIEETLKRHPEIDAVYLCYHETGTGLLNPMREIGAVAHKHGKILIADTTSAYAMIPIDMAKDNVDFIMASAQKGIMAMTGLSFVIGKIDLIEQSKKYNTRSYYSNLYMQYDFIKNKGEMHFTPPVQTIYAAVQAVKEYWQEGEATKWERHQEVWREIKEGATALGFKMSLPEGYQSRLVVSVEYPTDKNWNFDAVHDYCYAKGFTIYPGKIAGKNTFRLCSLGAIYPKDIKDFFVIFKQALTAIGVDIPVSYNR